MICWIGSLYVINGKLVVNIGTEYKQFKNIGEAFLWIKKRYEEEKCYEEKQI